MKPLFHKGSSLQMRLLCTLVAAITLMLAERQMKQFTVIRHYLDTAITPFHYVANAPWIMLDRLSEQLTTRHQLLLENRALRKELLLKKSKLLLLDQLKKENARFRQLLDVPVRQPHRKMIAHIISTSPNEYSHQVTIDKGERQGVYPGHPIINDKGVVGQVVATSKTTSRVLLICDATHAIPVRVERNDIRAIAQGTGELAWLQLEALPLSIDIKVGDHLITSGLDGCFPEGYSVATVTSVVVDHRRARVLIKAKPTVALERLHYLLLLRPDLPLDPLPEQLVGQPPLSAPITITTNRTPYE